jgi:hypothetical protein
LPHDPYTRPTTSPRRPRLRPSVANVIYDQRHNDQYQCSDNVVDRALFDPIHDQKRNLNHVVMADQRGSHNGDGEYDCGEGQRKSKQLFFISSAILSLNLDDLEKVCRCAQSR